MKRGVILLIYVILLSFLNESFAQNYLWLMNGKKLTIGNYEFVKNNEDSFLNFSSTKGKYKTIDMIDVYSISDSIGNEIFSKSIDTINGILMKENNLKYYIQGEFDAREKYQDKFAFISSYSIGFVSVFYPPFSKIFFFPVYPSTYISILGLSGPNYEQVVLNTTAKINEPYYIIGYKEAAKRKRIKNGLIGAGLGVLSGVALAFLIGY